MESMPSRFRRLSPEVVYSDGDFLAVDRSTIELLREAAASAPRRRCRLCFHAGPESLQQEMLIVMHSTSYVRPHRHYGRSETLTVVEGHCDAMLFDETGQLKEHVPMSCVADGGSFFYRMPQGVFHTLRSQTEWLAFLETTTGPFQPASTDFAHWAPLDSDASAGHAFLSRVSLQARELQSGRQP
jgi:cupin fold WbuC family metalloprotein